MAGLDIISGIVLFYRSPNVPFFHKTFYEIMKSVSHATSKSCPCTDCHPLNYDRYQFLSAFW